MIATTLAVLPTLVVAPRGWGLPQSWPREVVIVGGASVATAVGVAAAAAECLYAVCVYEALVRGGGVARALVDFGERVAHHADLASRGRALIGAFVVVTVATAPL